MARRRGSKAAAVHRQGLGFHGMKKRIEGRGSLHIRVSDTELEGHEGGGRTGQRNCGGSVMRVRGIEE